MEPLFIVVERRVDKTFRVIDFYDKLSAARGSADVLARSSPGAEFLVFECKGLCVQEPVWKPVKEPATRDVGDGTSRSTERY